MKPNFIKCRFCEWKTARWGKGTNPTTAFRKLYAHLIECHIDQAETIFGEDLDPAEIKDYVA